MTSTSFFIYLFSDVPEAEVGDVAPAGVRGEGEVGAKRNETSVKGALHYFW